jgi:beta-glucosidase
LLRPPKVKIEPKIVALVPGAGASQNGWRKYFEEYSDKMEEAIEAAKNADAIILCLGRENTYTETIQEI